MLNCEPGTSSREPHTEELDVDLVVVGGGMAGCCAAIAAARAGCNTVLIHDRPVLGGNAGSEVRLWVLGATCHMGSNNRWSREGGILNEILTENLWRNPDSNPLIFDSVLLEWVSREPHLRLLLNTPFTSCTKRNEHEIASVEAWNPQNQTRYRVAAPLFMDSSGDGVLGFQAGAAFRMGAESAEEFDEPFAPDDAYGGLLGHSLYFYTKDVGYETPFVAPAFALKDIEGTIPRWRDFKVGDTGCRLWWIEFGGRLDTVHDTEHIKWELWKIAYGVWDWMKNSGRFPETRTMTLEWFGHIPGKRESRRFEGDHMLSQREVVAQQVFPDEVAYGGWAFDLHPADGVYSALPGCTHIRCHGIYGIPFRCLYSRNISNLLLGGRVISISHVAFGSTRVMGTLAACGQAAGEAAVLCLQRNCTPRDLLGDMSTLQHRLQRTGVHLPSYPYEDPDDLAAKAEISFSSRLRLSELPPGGRTLSLDCARGQWLPLPAGRIPRLEFRVDAERDTLAVCEFRACSRDGFHTPDEVLARLEVPVSAGPDRVLKLDPGLVLDRDRYVLVMVEADSGLALHTSDQLVSGIIAVARKSRQQDVERLGFHDFDWWAPARRPAPQNLALRCEPPLDGFSGLNTGWTRPTRGANWWVADPGDPSPRIELRWPEPVTISEVVIFCDPDYEHPMEHVLFRHHDRISPYMVRNLRLTDGKGGVVAEVRENRQGLLRIALPSPRTLDLLRIEILAAGEAPAALAAVRVYS